MSVYSTQHHFFSIFRKSLAIQGSNNFCLNSADVKQAGYYFHRPVFLIAATLL